MDIHEAAARGVIDDAARALIVSERLSAREPTHGYTPLMVAAASEQAGLPMARFLVEHGADVNARAWTVETAPADILAATSDEYASYQFTGDTALTLAAAKGDLALVTYLLDVGADLHARNSSGYDALINAVGAGVQAGVNVSPLVALLLNRGAVPDRATAYGETPLGTAARSGLFDIVKLLFEAGADPTPLHWNQLHHAVVFGTVADVQTALESAPDLEARDRTGRTALHLSLQLGDLAKAQILRDAGASLANNAEGRSPLGYAISAKDPAVVAWLLEQGCDVHGADSSGVTPLMQAAEAGTHDVVRQLLAAGARVDDRDAYDQTAMARVTDVEAAALLLAAGAEINESGDELRKALFGIPVDGGLTVAQVDYLAAKARRFGTTNPEIMDVPFWHDMVRTRSGAYTARMHFADTDRFDSPVWCFKRFGRTLTALPDSRYVEIAGEHEDYYDPDFCIYNDVVVYHGDGTFTLYGYPEALFPPTDFHTATLVGSFIYLIGSLGYQGTRRSGETPVYRLRWDTWEIEQVATSGETPGWLSRHQATYEAASNRIVVRGGQRIVQQIDDSSHGDTPSIPEEQYVANEQTYALHLPTMAWSQIAHES